MKKLLNELSKKSYLTDEEFKDYKKVLKDACDPKREGNIEKMGKPFTKTGMYRRTKIQKLVCMTKTILEDEIWKIHPNSHYGIEVSNYGRVRIIIKQEEASIIFGKDFDIKALIGEKINLLKDYVDEKDEVWTLAQKLNRPDVEIEISNFRQIRILKEYKILTQFEKSHEYDGYLEVEIPNYGKTLVYKLVAETFKPINNIAGYEVHHINNNSYENTPENLIWLSTENRRQIH